MNRNTSSRSLSSEVVKLNADRRVTQPLHNRIDHWLANIGQSQHGWSKNLVFVEQVIVVLREEAGPTGPELVDHRVDVLGVDAEEQVNGSAAPRGNRKVDRSSLGLGASFFIAGASAHSAKIFSYLMRLCRMTALGKRSFVKSDLLGSRRRGSD